MARKLILSMIVVGGAFLPTMLHAESCENLSKLASPTISITLANTIDSGAFTPPRSTVSFPRLPAFCRVTASLKPTSDSDIRIEVWLPIADWNGKFLAVGSGGWGGFFNYDGMANALRRGYATSATDDGHTGGGASFVVGHPEKFIDFAYRAEHEMATEAKTLIKAFYGREARNSYWTGCSGGGHEGLLQAYRYPDEFDGIIAGAPPNVRRNAWALWLAVQTFKDSDAYIPPEKYPMIHRAVLDACDANDGLKDGLIEDPESCHFDFKALQCKAADGPDCLTSRQVHTAQTIISPATTRTGKVLFPRLEPGTELGWARLAGGPSPADLFLDEFRYVVYQDPKWDWRTFDLERDSAKADAINKDINDLDPHLVPFAKHGGKLLIFHGWADQQVAPGSSIEFYKSVLTLSANPEQAANWIRLFMVPGMGHCLGGEGPDTFDKISRVPAGQLSLRFREDAVGLRRFWQRRYYDFNVYSRAKVLEKLNYMHSNPVREGLVQHPGDWPWSSWCFYYRGQGLLAMDPGTQPASGLKGVQSEERPTLWKTTKGRPPQKVLPRLGVRQPPVKARPPGVLSMSC